MGVLGLIQRTDGLFLQHLHLMLQAALPRLN
jgi:hypothetical protein